MLSRPHQRSLSVLLCWLLGCVVARSQVDTGSLSRAGLQLTCPRNEGDTAVALLAPAAFRSGEVLPVSRFELRFTDSVPAVAQSALTFAAAVWESYLRSTAPVVVDVDWADRDDDRLLASAGPTTLFRDFPDAEPGVWYPVALAEAIVGETLNEPDEADIAIVVNAQADWYFGTDASPPRGQTDLVTVALHELGHGLGFISSADTIRGVELALGFSGRFLVYDTYLESSGRQLVDSSAFTNPGELLFAAVTGADLAFAGPTVLDRNAGEPAPLFSPPEFDIGSSVSHFDEATYPTGTREALMTPALASGEAIHDPGPLALALLADLGWDVRFDLGPAVPPVGARDLATAGVVLAPNPVRDRLRATGLGDLDGERGEVVVTDVGGAVVARVSTAEFAARGLDVASLAPGLYTVRVGDLGSARFLRS